MRYLGDRGSNIRLLVFAPMEQLEKAASPDKNGHVWPNYFYYRERMRGHRGADISFARPLLDWKAEVPDAIIMEDL
jgi:hypothetical protein